MEISLSLLSGVSLAVSDWHNKSEVTIRSTYSGGVHLHRGVDKIYCYYLGGKLGQNSISWAHIHFIPPGLAHNVLVGNSQHTYNPNIYMIWSNKALLGLSA